jgi:hypothetical protein
MFRDQTGAALPTAVPEAPSRMLDIVLARLAKVGVDCSCIGTDYGLKHVLEAHGDMKPAMRLSVAPLAYAFPGGRNAGFQRHDPPFGHRYAGTCLRIVARRWVEGRGLSSAQGALIHASGVLTVDDYPHRSRKIALLTFASH